MRRRALLAALVLVLALAGTACSDADDPTVDRAEPPSTASTAAGSPSTSTTEGGFQPQPIHWIDCGGAECASLEVPLDYARPRGRRIELGVLRVPARGERIGPLFVNPGGPGASAIDTARALGSVLPDEVTEHFDIVGVDPRGVGESAPLDCNGDFAELYGVDPTIEDGRDRTRLLDVSRRYVAGCQAVAGARLPFYGTREVARDMDAVRAAMGDDELSYVGFSYGTSIGQVYAELFPRRVRALVLDGVVELGPSGIEQAVEQARGFERALRSFTDDCAADSSCPLRPDPLARIDELLRRAERTIPAPGASRPLGPGEVSIGLAYPLYSQSLWGQLAEAADAALDGDGSAMVGLADQYLHLASFDVYFAAGCLDSEWPEGADRLLAAAKDAAGVSPRFGEAIVNDYVRCAIWPTDEKPLPAVTAAGAAPILVISTRNDPATPYESGVRVAQRLRSGVLLTYEGEGHTVFGNGIDCIDDTVTRYLVELDPPRDGTVCD